MKYWNNQGKYQAHIEACRLKLVPDQGPAETPAGELLRLLENVYYDFGNNHGCNFDAGRREDLCGLVYWLGRVEESLTGDAPKAAQRIWKALPYLVDPDRESLSPVVLKECCDALDTLLDWFAMNWHALNETEQLTTH